MVDTEHENFQNLYSQIPTRKLYIHFIYKNCTRCIQLMHTKCKQNVYKMHTTFLQTFVYILYTQSKELCQLNFVYKTYTKVCQMWDTFCIQTFCIHFVHKSLSICGIYFVSLQTFFIHFVYKIYTQTFVEMWDTFCIQTFRIHHF